jgi:predicted DNA-binding transcriptional regulator AlpA
MSDDERDAFTIPEFCRRHGFSQAKYFELASAGEGPRVMRLGRRVLISRESASDWRRQREALSAEAAKASA